MIEITNAKIAYVSTIAGNKISLPEIVSFLESAKMPETDVNPCKIADKKPTIVKGSTAKNTPQPCAAVIVASRPPAPKIASTKP